jgi:hypothetical protein
VATYKQRLQAILTNDLITDWESRFATDLIHRLDRKRSLSVGQRRTLDKVEKVLAERIIQSKKPNKLGDEISNLIEGAEKGSYTLSAWQMNIMKSFRMQVLRGASLSEKQMKILDDVRQASNPVNQAAWEKEYNSDYKASAEKLHQIYNKSPYWQNVWATIGAGKVPDKTRFLRMFRHNRIQGLLHNMTVVPKYSVGDYMTTRANAGVNMFKYRRKNADTGAMSIPFLYILKINPTLPRTYAKGGNTYLVNPVGTMDTMVVEERDLRKINKKEKSQGRTNVG